MMTLNDLFAVNGQSDEQEPWCAADSCDEIDINGEDIIVLCDDGVARWTNCEREWSEVDGSAILRTAEEIYGTGPGGNAAEAAKFIEWMSEWWPISDEIGRCLDEYRAEIVEDEAHEQFPETAEMPREILRDYLLDLNHPSAEILEKVLS